MKQSKRNYDAPKDGYQRWTTYIKTELLEQFKMVAANEDKTLVEAIEEAVINWAYPDGDTHD
jgi:hypothetical protein